MNYLVPLYEYKQRQEQKQLKKKYEEILKTPENGKIPKEIYVICFNNFTPYYNHIFDEVMNFLNYLDNKYVIIISISKGVNELTNIKKNTMEFRNLFKFYIDNYNEHCNITEENIENLKCNIIAGINGFEFLQYYEKRIFFIM